MNGPGTLALVAALVLGVALLFCGKHLRRLGYVVAGGAIALLVFFVYQMERLHHADAGIRLGASRHDVLDAQGQPTAVTDCSTTYGGYVRTSQHERIKGCADVLWYYSFLTPEAWEYVFDANARLIHKYHWQSP